MSVFLSLAARDVRNPRGKSLWQELFLLAKKANAHLEETLGIDGKFVCPYSWR